MIAIFVNVFSLSCLPFFTVYLSIEISTSRFVCIQFLGIFYTVYDKQLIVQFY